MFDHVEHEVGLVDPLGMIQMWVLPVSMHGLS